MKFSFGEDDVPNNLFCRCYSYLHYGLLAARAEILKSGDDPYSHCILGGHHGMLDICTIKSLETIKSRF